MSQFWWKPQSDTAECWNCRWNNWISYFITGEMFVCNLIFHQMKYAFYNDIFSAVYSVTRISRHDRFLLLFGWHSPWNGLMYNLHSDFAVNGRNKRLKYRVEPFFLRTPHSKHIQQVAVAANCAVSVIRRQHVLDTRLSGKCVYTFHASSLATRNLAMCCTPSILCLGSVNGGSGWYAKCPELMQFAHFGNPSVCHREWIETIIILLATRVSRT